MRRGFDLAAPLCPGRHSARRLPGTPAAGHASIGPRLGASSARLARVQIPNSLDLSLDVDRGELEAICLAQEINASAVLMDDRRGRKAATDRGIAVIGTIGLLEQAAAAGAMELRPALERLQQTNARLDPELIQAALARNQARKSSG